MRQLIEPSAHLGELFRSELIEFANDFRFAHAIIIAELNWPLTTYLEVNRPPHRHACCFHDRFAHRRVRVHGFDDFAFRRFELFR